MVCLGLKSGAAGWKVQTNSLSYGGTPGYEYVNHKFSVEGKVTHQLGTFVINVGNFSQ